MRINLEKVTVIFVVRSFVDTNRIDRQGMQSHETRSQEELLDIFQARSERQETEGYYGDGIRLLCPVHKTLFHISSIDKLEYEGKALEIR